MTKVLADALALSEAARAELANEILLWRAKVERRANAKAERLGVPSEPPRKR